MKKIFYLSGTRADYGLMNSTLRAIEAEAELELSIIITAMHLASDMGKTVNIVAADGFRIVEQIDSCLASDSKAGMARGVALTMLGVIQTLERERPDLLLLLGDRGESLAAACAASFMQIPVVHIHCGDLSAGHIDNLTRFAISQYAHILLPATKMSAKRLSGCGVPASCIHVVGAPGLDDIVAGKYSNEKTLRNKLDLNDKPVLTVLYHPASAEADSAEKMQQLLEIVLAKKNFQCVVLGCNADAGGRAMLQMINQYREQVKFSLNLPREDYLGLLAFSKALVGNSSSGIIEAASFGLPVLNIGSRQSGRQCGANVKHVDSNTTAIKSGLGEVLSEEFLQAAKSVVNPYGDGQSGKRIAKILSTLKINRELLEKNYKAANL